MNQGKGAAWQRLGNLENGLSDIVTEQEKLNNAHEKKKQDALDNYNKEKEKKANKRNNELAGITTGAKTKYLNFEHALTNAFRKEGGLIDIFADAQRRLEIDPNDSEAVAIKANIKRQVDDLAKIKNGILGYNTKLAEGIANKTISANLNKGFITNMQKINDGEIEFEISKFGDIKILNPSGVDLDGDGYPDEITLQSISDKNNFGVWEKDFDMNTFNTGLKKQFGEKHTKNDDGTFTTTEEKGYNPAYAGDVKNKYREVFGKDVNSLTNQGKSYIYQLGLTPKQVRENPALYDEIIDNAEKGFRNMFDNKKFETTNHNAENAAARTKIAKSADARAWAQQNKKEEPKQGLSVMTAPGKNNDFIPVIKENKDGKKMMMFNTGLNKKGEPVSVDTSKGKFQILEVGLTDDGKISFMGAEISKGSVTTKDGNETTRQSMELKDLYKSMTPTEINQVAESMGYGNYEGLKKALIEARDKKFKGYSVNDKDLDKDFAQGKKEKGIRNELNEAFNEDMSEADIKKKAIKLGFDTEKSKNFLGVRKTKLKGVDFSNKKKAIKKIKTELFKKRLNNNEEYNWGGA